MPSSMRLMSPVRPWLSTSMPLPLTLKPMTWSEVKALSLTFVRRFKSPVQLSSEDLFDHKATEIIDVRTPAEYELDHIPGAVNIPVLDNDQRVQVGTFYNENSFEARKLGASLITKNISDHIQTHFYEKPKNYSPLVYCWRGGQRSRSLAIVLAEIGFDVHTLTGGYKAYRKKVLADLEVLPKRFKYYIISGMTGTGKTFLLSKMAEHGHQVLDLEYLAKHKGSMLGLWHNEKQPSQKNWETQLRVALSTFDPNKPVWVESESRNIGKISIPYSLFHEFRNSKRFQIHLPLSERVKCTMRDYPHWTVEKEQLKTILSKLRKFHSKSKVDNWISLADSEQWEELVVCLFRDHYDPTYTCSQNKNKHSNEQDEVYMSDQSEASVQKVIHYLGNAVL